MAVSGPCRLCFSSETTTRGVIFTNIQKFEYLLSSLGPMITPSENVSTAVCSSCENQLDAIESFRKRVQFTETLWTRYQHRFNQITTPGGDKGILCDDNISLNCHICGVASKFRSLQTHLSSDHHDHVSNCDLCKTLLESHVILPVDQYHLKFSVLSSVDQSVYEEEEVIEEELVQDTPQECTTAEPAPTTIIPTEPPLIVKIETIVESMETDDFKESEITDFVFEEMEETEGVDHTDEVIEEDGEEEEDDDYADGDDDDDDSEDSEDDLVEEVLPVEMIIKSVVNDKGLKERRYFCHIKKCDKNYARSDKLRIHLLNKHKINMPNKNGGDPVKNTCSWCGKMFSDQKKLDRHLLSHNLTPFACPICDTPPFATRFLLQQHRTLEHPTIMSEIDSERPYSCLVCGKSYARFEQLRIHLKKHPDVNLADYTSEMAMARFPCTMCASSYTRLEKLDKHMLTHDANPFHCDFCDQEFNSRLLQKQHQDECTVEVVLLPCPSCEKMFTSTRLLSLHQDEHEDLELACNVCGKTFGTRLLLNQHLRTKHEKPFQCTECGKQLSRQDKLDNHMKQHNGYPCKECGQLFGTRRELRGHDLVHNPEASTSKPEKEKKPRINCHLCPASFLSETKLEIHLQATHDEKGYYCEKCGVTFEDKLKFRAHEYKHKAKLCGICGVTTNAYAVHMRRHEGLKPFKCQVEGCGLEFPRNCDLTSHTKTHTGEKNYSCDLCGMRFSRPNKVTLHMRTHTGEKPYKCEFENCTREFSQSFDRTLHMRRHTGDKPYECEKCQVRFYLSSLLKKHQQTCLT